MAAAGPSVFFYGPTSTRSKSPNHQLPGNLAAAAAAALESLSKAAEDGVREIGAGRGYRSGLGTF